MGEGWRQQVQQARYSRGDGRRLRLEGHHGRGCLDSRRVSGIPWCLYRTNVPITLFFFFFGTTVASDVCGGPTSPYSDEHTPGGSTGGEPAAALLVYGWLQLQTVDQDATDVAGSVRIPVHN